jgi:hypothetical protein
MIRYTLRCSNAHEFEAWFRSMADFERAVADGEAVCPVCGDTSVEKALMTPAVAGTHKSEVAAKDDKVRLAAPDPRQQAMREAIKAMRKQVTENADYVGDKFAEEARKIHYNEVEARGIYGEATGDEAQALADEGIDFLPLPSLPEDRN